MTTYMRLLSRCGSTPEMSTPSDVSPRGCLKVVRIQCGSGATSTSGRSVLVSCTTWPPSINIRDYNGFSSCLEL